MTLPKDQAAREALLLKVANGNQDAARFLHNISIAARLADDIADMPELKGEGPVGDLLAVCLISIPSSKFFRENYEYLAAPLNEAIVGWQTSAVMKSGDLKRQTFGYVYRESTDRIAVAVAFLTGGVAHSRQMLKEIYDQCHAPFDETVEQWGAS